MAFLAHLLVNVASLSSQYPLCEVTNRSRVGLISDIIHDLMMEKRMKDEVALHDALYFGTTLWPRL